MADFVSNSFVVLNGVIRMKEFEIISDRKADKDKSVNIKVLIFTEGTLIGPRNVLQHFNHASYVPIGNSNDKTNDWYKQGADIFYLTSRKKEKQIVPIADILKKYNFAPGVLICREENEKYKDIVENIKPDILIEDDCRSIGGKWQMCITYVNPEIKRKIKSIVVKEFKGVDHLPSMVVDLMRD